MDAPGVLLLLTLAFLVGVALFTVAMVKTVRFHGWEHSRWAPPAVPWFVASMVVGALAGGILRAMG